MLPLLPPPVPTPVTTTLHCGAQVRISTPTLTAANGVRFTLRVSADDDHEKMTHDCQADYTAVAQAVGSPAIENQQESSDGSWDRKITIELDGFAPGGTAAFGVIRELDKYPSTTLFRVNMATAAWSSYDLAHDLHGELPRACLPLVTVAGVTAAGEIVVTAPASPHCSGARLALSVAQDQNRRDIVRAVRRLSQKETISPLDPGSSSAP